MGLFKKGWYEKALSELERAVAVVPDDPIMQDHLGDAYFHLAPSPRSAPSVGKIDGLKARQSYCGAETP